MSKTRNKFEVCVVEDDEPVLKSLCALLEAHGYKTHPFNSAEKFQNRRDLDAPVCLLLDLRLPGMSGMHLQKQLNDSGARIPIVILTAHGDVPLAVQAIRGGAVDFIEKPAKSAQIIKAIETAGRMLFNQDPPEAPKAVIADRLAKLTDREQEILDRMLQVKLNKEIAAELGISQRTVEVHRSRIREKMQARGIADLIRMLS